MSYPKIYTEGNNLKIELSSTLDISKNLIDDSYYLNYDGAGFTTISLTKQEWEALRTIMRMENNI